MTIEIQKDAVRMTVGKNKKRGFTLTEIAIVLGIVGLILGAIWVAAAAVYTNMRISNSNRHLLVITQSIRSLFATSTSTGIANGIMTASLIPAGVFPTDLASATSTQVNSAWSGARINVYSATITSQGDAFQVQFEGIPPAGCINLLTSSTGSGRDPGMVGAGGATTASTNAAITTLTDLTLSTANVPAGTAATACGSNATSAAAFKFRLRV